jgi:hypothetical protein
VKVADWLARSRADAEARGLPELGPLLETLARSTKALRDADAEFGHPGTETAQPADAVEPADAAEASDHDDR